MFGTIRKHSTALWLVIIALTIISFVIFFTPDVGRRVGGAGDELGTINGRSVTREDYESARRETMLRFLFSFGSFPTSEADARARGVNLGQETIQRLFLRDRLREHNIQAGDKALANFITSSPAFRNRETGGFQKEAYEMFIRRNLAEQGMKESDFLDYARTEIGIQRLVELYGQSGRLISPAEVEELYRQENEQFTTEVVTFSPFDFVGKVNTSSTNLSQFFSNRLALYRLPERLVVQFVKFDFASYHAVADAELAKTTNLAQRIDAIYNVRGPSFFTDEKNQPLSPEAAKAKIRSDLREEQAALAARKAANAFATELDNMEPKKPENLAALAQKKGLQLMESQPFSELDTPAGLKVMENFSRQAFSITPEEPFRGPLPGNDAYFVIAQKRKLPSEIPSMESVLQKVMDDYRSEESVKLARSAGENFGAKVKAGLASGKAWDKLCAENKVTARSLPAFALGARFVEGLDRSLSLFDLQNVVQSLTPGQASKFSPTREGGFVVYVKSRLPVSEDKLRQELPEFTAMVRRARQSQAFQEWFRKNMETARISGRIASIGGN